MNKNLLFEKLQAVERLATTSKLNRLLYQPIKYVYSISFRKLIYKRYRKEKQVKSQTFFGSTMQLLLPSSTDIYLTGGKSHDSEIRLAKFLIHTLNQEDTFIDVGGHYGYFTLLAAKLVGVNGKVYSFEAAPNTYRILNENCSKAKNIECFNLAVSDEVGDLVFYEFPNLYSEYNSLDVDQFKDEDWYSSYNPTQVKVKSVILDQFVSSQKINPKVVKIDVEGAEYHVISGMNNYLSHNSPLVVMEYLAEGRSNVAHQKAESHLRSLGYHAFVIDDSGSLIEIDCISSYLEKNAIESDNIVFVKNQ